MKILDYSRGMGKTHDCVVASLQTGNHILVPTKLHKVFLMDNDQTHDLEAKYGKILPEVYCVEELLNLNIKEEDRKNLIIDEFDFCFELLLAKFGASACLGTVTSNKLKLNIDNKPSLWGEENFVEMVKKDCLFAAEDKKKRNIL